MHFVYCDNKSTIVFLFMPKSYILYLPKIQENAFQYIHKRSMFVQCETSEGNMQEKIVNNFLPIWELSQ